MEQMTRHDVNNQALQQELEAMYDRDQSVRLEQDRYSVEDAREIDRNHRARLQEIVKEFGWPKISEVGRKAAIAAFLVVQHSDEDVEFQQAMLPLVEAAAESGEARKEDVAFLVDRIRVNSGQSQRFGTQFYKVNGVLTPRPIENPKELDNRRKEFNLSSMAEYHDTMRQMQEKRSQTNKQDT